MPLCICGLFLDSYSNLPRTPSWNRNGTLSICNGLDCFIGYHIINDNFPENIILIQHRNGNFKLVALLHLTIHVGQRGAVFAQRYRCEPLCSSGRTIIARHQVNKGTQSGIPILQDGLYGNARFAKRHDKCCAFRCLIFGYDQIVRGLHPVLRNVPMIKQIVFVNINSQRNDSAFSDLDGIGRTIDRNRRLSFRINDLCDAPVNRFRSLEYRRESGVSRTKRDVQRVLGRVFIAYISARALFPANKTITFSGNSLHSQFRAFPPHCRCFYISRRCDRDRALCFIRKHCYCRVRRSVDIRRNGRILRHFEYDICSSPKT